MSWLLKPSLLSACALLAASSGEAQSQARRPLVVVSDTACPSGEQVTSLLGPMLRVFRVVPRPERADAAVARVFGEKTDYGVRVGLSDAGQRVWLLRRRLKDPAQLCSDRARAVALVIALAIEPPDVAPPPPPPPKPPRSSAKPWRRALEMSALVAVAPGVEGDGSRVSFGGSVRGVVGNSWIQAIFGVGLVSPLTLALGDTRVRLVRLPLDVGIRLLTSVGRWEFGGDAGLAASVLFASGENLVENQGGVRLDLGLRAAANVTYRWGARWGLLFGVQFSFFPSPFSLDASPQGTIGTTPRSHLAALLGASVKFD